MQHPHQCFKVISSFNLLSITRMVPNCSLLPQRPSSPQARDQLHGVLCVYNIFPYDICWKCHVDGPLYTLGIFWIQCNTETAAAEDSGN